MYYWGKLLRQPHNKVSGFLFLVPYNPMHRHETKNTKQKTDKMKAAVLKKYGSADNFMVEEIPPLEIGEGEVLIRNRASSVNPVDTTVRKGKLKLLSGINGRRVIGSDFSGTVMASRGESLKEGDDVFGFVNPVSGGAYAEEMIVSEHEAVLKPLELSYTEAAVLPLVAVTAWQGLVNKGGLSSGQRVLINGCSGGVGSAAVQIAKSSDTVITGICSGKHAGFARSIGCEQVIDYEKQSIQIAGKFDLIFDANGNLTLADVTDHLTDEAVFVSTRGGADDLKGALGTAVQSLKKRVKLLLAQPDTEDLQQIRQLAEHKKLRPYIARSFPIKEISEAHLMMEEESFTGKISITI